MPQLSGKTVVITGAASGIGRALALACAARGAQLMLSDINQNGLAETAAAARAAGARVETQVTDTGDAAAIAALAEATRVAFGGADILVNNAGVGLAAPVEAMEMGDAHWLMNINFWGVVNGCRAFLPQLRSRPEAMIVNLSSIFAMISMPTQSMYNAAKAGVRAFSDALRLELRHTTVQVLCVHPGHIRTNIANATRWAADDKLDMPSAQMRRFFNESGRATSPAQAAEVILRAVERDRRRVMVGPDAVIADWLYRLVPTRASAWLYALGTRLRGVKV